MFHMRDVHSVIRLLAFSVAIAGSGAASGDAFPLKTIRIITAEAGSANDVMARLIASGLSASLGQPVIVDNRGMTAMEAVARAPNDGYTLLSFGPPLWILPLMRNHVPWDAVRDFAPITLAMSAPSILAVHPSVPVKTVGELLVLAKAKPGALDYAGSFPGSTSHLSGELFKAMAGVKVVYVPYKGPASALNALIAGETHVIFVNVPSATPHSKSGRLRTLAVTSAQPSALAPGLPTVAASGVPGYESVSPFGVFAPARTPEAIVGLLNQEIVKVLSRSDVKEKLFGFGGEVVASTPEKFAAAIKTETVTWGKVIRDAGVRER